MEENEHKLVQIMHSDLSALKEYLMCFAEGEGFHHAHIHIVARPADLPSDLKGPHVFAFLAVDRAQAISAEASTLFCIEFMHKLQAMGLRREHVDRNEV